MTNQMIEKFVDARKGENKMIRIQFKDRSDVKGIFIFGKDYQELKKRNFWRIVAAANADEWLNTGDMSCSRLYSGDPFTRLSDM